MNARLTLREVRRTLNEFRDKRWEGLVRARNQLLGTIMLTTFVTHVLLCIAILTGADYLTILKVTAFYMVGATAGLFGQVYNESRRNTAIDDFSLSLARLITVPLLSGLAGIGGVLITRMLEVTQSTTLELLFRNADDPRYLLAAIVFGFTPNLVISSLQQRADKYASELASSKSTGKDNGTNQ